MTHEYSPYENIKDFDTKHRAGDGWRKFTNPKLYKGWYRVDPSMVDVFELMDERGIGYSALAELCYVSPPAISTRMRSGAGESLKAEMKNIIKAHGTLNVITPKPAAYVVDERLEQKPLHDEKELERVKNEEDAIRWQAFIELVTATNPERVGLWTMQNILRLQTATNIMLCASGDDE